MNSRLPAASSVVAVLVMVMLAGAATAVAQTAATPTTDSQFFTSNSARIVYLDTKVGEPVVLIHGFTGSYARHWQGPGVVDALTQAGYRAIALDCRGHGQSDKPHDAEAYGFEMVDDVIRLLDHLHLERAHIVGYSMGGAIANQLLIKYPARLKSVILLGAGWEGEDLTQFRSQMDALADGFARKDASPLLRAVTASGATAPAPSEADIAALSASLFARNDAEALAAVARGMTTLFDVPAAQLRVVRLPVLAIVGELDQSNVGSVKRMRGVVPGLEVVELPGANHATSVRPAAAHIVAFLNRHR
jgi:pimeloyl-ACP methyl ester carboxylesterase